MFRVTHTSDDYDIIIDTFFVGNRTCKCRSETTTPKYHPSKSHLPRYFLNTSEGVALVVTVIGVLGWTAITPHHDSLDLNPHNQHNVYIEALVSRLFPHARLANDHCSIQSRNECLYSFHHSVTRSKPKHNIVRRRFDNRCLLLSTS
jgi:hypothetical protein